MMAPSRPASRLAAALLLTLAAGGAIEAALSAPRELRFGVIAEEENEPDHMLKVFAVLLAEMRTRLAPRGVGVAPLVIARDLTDLSGRIKQGAVDMVIESVFPTLELQERSDQALAPSLLVIRREQREYHSVFFTRRNSGIKNLDDLRGKTLVLQAERSTSAFAVPRAELARRGIGLAPAGQGAGGRNRVLYLLAGAELNEAIWVLDGKGDAGAFNNSDWARLPEKVRSELVIFHETRPLLRGALSLRVGMDPVVKRASEEVLLSLHQDAAGQAALASAAGITRFERLTAKDLAEIDEWRLAFKRASVAR